MNALRWLFVSPLGPWCRASLFFAFCTVVCFLTTMVVMIFSNNDGAVPIQASAICICLFAVCALIGGIWSYGFGASRDV